jgi:hypothetical protein
MKRDTNLKSELLFHELLLKKSNEDRLIMGCSMFGTAKEIVAASILNENPHISTEDLKKEIFIRFYGTEVNYQHIFDY